MVVVQLTPDQVQLMRNTEELVYLQDESGQSVWTATHLMMEHPFTQAEIKELLRRSKAPGPRYTTAQVLEMLKELEVEGK